MNILVLLFVKLLLGFQSQAILLKRGEPAGNQAVEGGTTLFEEHQNFGLIWISPDHLLSC